jgi:hypothetical protein
VIREADRTHVNIRKLVASSDGKIAGTWRYVVLVVEFDQALVHVLLLAGNPTCFPRVSSKSYVGVKGAVGAATHRSQEVSCTICSFTQDIRFLSPHGLYIHPSVMPNSPRQGPSRHSIAVSRCQSHLTRARWPSGRSAVQVSHTTSDQIGYTRSAGSNGNKHFSLSTWTGGNNIYFFLSAKILRILGFLTGLGSCDTQLVVMPFGHDSNFFCDPRDHRAFIG